MSNQHIKTINGRKYYYESIRRGKKVTSRYIGPVERIRRRKKSAQEAAEQEMQIQDQQQEATSQDDTNYIG